MKTPQLLVLSLGFLIFSGAHAKDSQSYIKYKIGGPGGTSETETFTLEQYDAVNLSLLAYDDPIYKNSRCYSGDPDDIEKILHKMEKYENMRASYNSGHGEEDEDIAYVKVDKVKNTDDGIKVKILMSFHKSHLDDFEENAKIRDTKASFLLPPCK